MTREGQSSSYFYEMIPEYPRQYPYWRTTDPESSTSLLSVPRVHWGCSGGPAGGAPVRTSCRTRPAWLPTPATAPWTAARRGGVLGPRPLAEPRPPVPGRGWSPRDTPSLTPCPPASRPPSLVKKSLAGSTGSCSVDPQSAAGSTGSCPVEPQSAAGSTGSCPVGPQSAAGSTGSCPVGPQLATRV